MLLALVAQIACLHSDGFDNLLGSLAHELNSFVSLGTDRNTLLSLLTCLLPFFAWLYLLSASAWFATALLSLGFACSAVLC